MPDTGAPWNIPYVAGTDLVRDWPTDSQDLAEAIADGLDGTGFDSVATITATDATWTVPSLANTIVRVTCAGGGGGGGGGGGSTATASNGGTGGTTTFDAGAAGSISATGGNGGNRSPFGNSSDSPLAATLGMAGGGGGGGGGNETSGDFSGDGGHGHAGKVVVGYLDLDGVSTVNVTIGAGGSGGSGGVSGGAGGRGEVTVEYKAA